MKNKTSNHLTFSLIVVILLCSCATTSYNEVREPRTRNIEQRVVLLLKAIPALTSSRDIEQLERIEEILTRAKESIALINELGEGITVGELNDYAEKLILRTDMDAAYKTGLLLIKDIIITEVFPHVASEFKIEGVSLGFLQEAIEAAEIGVERARLIHESRTYTS